MLRNLAAADELPDEFVFRLRIENSNSFVALKSAGRSLGSGKDCLERCQSSEGGTSTFVALEHWVDEMLVCEELLFSPISSVRFMGSSFMSELKIVCKLHHFFLLNDLPWKSNRCVRVDAFSDSAAF